MSAESTDEQSQPPDDPDVLRAQIEDTRAELGETVEALSAKADVKAQAKEKVEETKADARAKVEQGREQLRETQAQAQVKLGEVSEQAKENPPLAAGIGGLVALALLIFLLRRRGSR